MSSLAAASNAPAHSHQLQSCRLFHDAKGRMHLIKPSNPQPLNKLHDTHITATLYARELLSSKRFPTAPNESTETLDNWSIYDEKLAMGKVGEWRDSRYSPYLPDGYVAFFAANLVNSLLLTMVGTASLQKVE
jgi:hypothetical protein